MPASGTNRLRTLQAKSAAAARWHSSDSDALAREYAVERIAAYVEKIVADAPPLTNEQRDRLTAILRGGGAHV